MVSLRPTMKNSKVRLADTHFFMVAKIIITMIAGKNNLLL